MEQVGNNSRRRFLKASTMLSLGAAFSQEMIGKAFANSQPIEIDKGQIGQKSIRLFKSGHFRNWYQH